MLTMITDVPATWVDQGMAIAFNLTTAIVLLVAGFVMAGWAQRLVRQRLYALKTFDRTLVPFISSIVRYAILVITFVLVLSEFGVQTASIIAVLGAAGLAIGLALQGTLSNVASGIMLLILRPFQVGHYIEAGGTSGTVQQIGLFMTELKTPQNVLRHVPNSAVFGDVISSYNAFPEMRVDLEIGISYDADISAAREVMLKVVAADDRFLQTPAPQVITKALADSSVNLEIRAWVAQDDFFATRFDLTREVKVALDAAEISIPYPHRQLLFPPDSASVAAPRKRKPRTTKRTSTKPV